MSSVAEVSARLKKVCDLDAAFLREYSGLHDDYDGTAADLSPSGIARALTNLGGDPLEDPHDEAQISATEQAMRVRFGEIEQHRRDPWVHIEALDVSSYERPYADAEIREEARSRHLRLWPDVVDNALESLDQVPAAVATAFLGSVKGMARNIRPSDGADGTVALEALDRLASHLRGLAGENGVSPSLGRTKLVSLLGCEDRIPVDLERLSGLATSEYERMEEIRADAARKVGDGRTVEQISGALRTDHGDFSDVLADTQREVALAAEFVRQRDLLPLVDDTCVIEEAPPARSWAPARVSWVAPWEQCGHAVFHIAAPAPEWKETDRHAWLDRFNRSASSVVAVHEVGPGHCSHALMMAKVPQPVRRTLWSELFFEGWAHYVEEMMWEEGYKATNPHFQFAMAEEAMMRTVRVMAAIGIHTGAMTVDDATAMFEAKTALVGPAARAEAVRGVWEPTYVRYTWGKALVKDIRDAAKAAWGSDFSLPRFHRELMGFGSPPVGLVPEVMGIRSAAEPAAGS